MKKFLLTALCMVMVLCTSKANSFEQGISPVLDIYNDYCILFETVDGSVANKICGKIILPNGSLTNNGDGSWSMTFVGGVTDPITTVNDITLDSDTKKFYLGDAQDASIYSDGTNMILDDVNIDPVTLQALADYKGGWGFDDPTDADDYTTIDYRQAGEFDVTIGAIFCETSSGSVEFDLQIDDGSPADIIGTPTPCDSSGVLVVSFAGDVSFDAGDKIDLVLTTVTDTPGDIKLFWFGKKKN